ncbi:nicotinate-nucleotide adenylyltransferase [Piscinibacter sp.]|jgi:nicotinate-nucleotide adenylyltransferase|uniref:nicotinate-nucleotide adenylyltransferase n=1 Tax=Piscinibacter sp. TaxID=1903157 RepID=UPI00355A3613
MRIGLFGGSFDPVHNAHVALAQTALDHLQLDEVRWIPAGQPWQKNRQLTPATDREAMVALAIQREPRFTLERCELQRSGASYTLDTVRELQAAQPGAQWFLIIGQDQYAGLHTWRDWQELLGLVTLAVAKRPGASAPSNPDVMQVAHREVALPMMDISSTEIRRRIAEGRGFTGMVPDAVARYIDQHHLYRGQSGS